MNTNLKLPALTEHKQITQTAATTSTKNCVGKFLKNPKIQINNSASVLQKSLYDWDSPSSSTGTIKRRPSPTTTTTTAAITTTPTTQNSKQILPQHKITTTTKQNKNFPKSESLLKNNLRGRTKNQVIKTNSKFQKFNQNNKLLQQQQQPNLQQNSSRSSDGCNKKFVKNNKTVKVDNTFNVSSNDNNDIDVVVENYNDKEVNIDAVNSTYENNIQPKGIVLNDPKNTEIFLTNSNVKNSFCKQKTKKSPQVIVTSKFSNQNHLNGVKCNGNEISKEDEISLFGSLQNTTRTIRKEIINDEEKFDTSEVEELNTIENTQKTNKNVKYIPNFVILKRESNQSNVGKIDNLNSFNAVTDALKRFSNSAIELNKPVVEIIWDISEQSDSKFLKNNQTSSSKVSPLKQSSHHHSMISILNTRNPPPYRNPPKPPTPPPISQIPSLNKIHSSKLNVGKKFILKNYSVKSNTIEKNSLHNNNNKTVNSPSNKGSHLNDLKNCISKFNSKFSLTSALNKVNLIQIEDNELKKTNLQINSKHRKSNETQINSNEYIIHCHHNTSKYLNKMSPDDLKSLTKPKFTSNQFKNIPIRPRKGPKISHLENYCLFDPTVDFINEKDQKSANGNEYNGVIVQEENKNKNLIDQKLDTIRIKDNNIQESFIFNNEILKDNLELIVNGEEFKNEVICNENLLQSEERKNIIKKMHHNYFTIDPEIFETDSNTNIASIEFNSSIAADNLQTMHVQNQFNLYDDRQSSTSTTTTIPNTTENFICDDKHTCIQITVNKDNIISKNLQNEQQQQQSNCCTLSNKITFVENLQKNFIQTADGHKMTIIEKNQPDQQQNNIPIDVKVILKQDEKQNCHDLNDISISCTQQQYNQNGNNFFVNSAKTYPKSLKRITKLRNGNGIKPEVNKCLPILNNIYCTSNESSMSKQVIKLCHSLEEIYNNPNSISSKNLCYNSRLLPFEMNLNSYREFDPHISREHQEQSIIFANNNKNILEESLHSKKVSNHHKTRPLSTKSDDSDSGFLSPNSSDELKFNSDIFWNKIQLMEQCENIQGYIEIYTDWANYYLERSKSNKRITDLSNDCRDGLILADIIETVTSFKVTNLIRNPKNQQEMHENVYSCLTTLRNNSINGTEDITAHDICSGHLKAILVLFFALSRFKQQLKEKQKSLISIYPIESENIISPIFKEHHQQINNDYYIQKNLNQIQRIQQFEGEFNKNQPQSSIIDEKNNLQNENMETMKVNWQKSLSYTKTNGTAIPLPATVLVQRRCPPDKVRPLPPTPNHVPSIPGLGKTGNSGSGSLSNSPINSHPHISLQSSPQKNSNNGLRPPQCKIPSSPFNSPKASGHSSNATTSTHTTSNVPLSDKPPPLPAANPPAPSKHSVLDKFKLFKSEKTSSSSNSSSKSERTSSSSGFSSARSERSDSSSSLNHLTSSTTKMKPPSKISTLNNDNSRIKESASKKLSKLSSSTEKNSSKQVKEKSPAKMTVKDEKVTNKLQKGSTKNLNPESEKGKSSFKSSSSTSEQKGSDTKLNGGMVRSNSTTISNNTGIPKPMAAIKGQTKTVHINGNDKSNSITKDISKSNCDSGVNNSQNSQNCEQSKTHIVRPLPTHPLQHHSININNGISSCSNSSTPQINGILKNYDNEKNTSNNIATCLTNNNSKSIGVGTQALNVPQTNGNESVTVNNKSSPIKMATVGTQNGESYEEEQPINVTPMKPLLEGYNSHVTILPTRSNQKVQYLITEFTTADIDIGQGYMSDGGESFRRVPVLSSRFLEIDNGYLSDGSVGNHLQHQQQQQQQQQQLTPHRQKHFLNGMRGRQLLPTTIIEERVRGSRGSLDSIGTGTQSLNSPTSTQQINLITNNNNNNNNINYNSISNNSNNNNFSCNNNNNNNNNNNSPSDISSSRGNLNSNNQINSDSDSTNMESKCDSNPSSRSSSRIGFINGRDNNCSQTTISINGSNDLQNKQISESNSNQKLKSSQKQTSSPSKTKGVPQSFGYIKRTNGSALGVVTTTATSTIATDQQKMMQQQQQQQQHQQQLQQQQMQQQQDPNRTAHVSGVQRNGKIKVSGVNQSPVTIQQGDVQTKIPPINQNRSFSLTGPGATQLSQAIRERLANGSYSLPKPGTEMQLFQHRVKYRHSGKILDGSLSDTQTYAEVKPEQSTYAMWLKHSNTTSSRLSAGDSIESLQHVLGSPAMQRHSAHKIIHRNTPNSQIINNGPVVETTYIQSPRLNRSNSIRSSKSDKMYSTLSSNQSGDVDTEPFYCLPVGSIQSQVQNGIITGGNFVRIAPWSQPTSPTPPTGRGGLLSPTHSGISSSGYNSITPSHRLTYPKRNDDVHGSTASLLSGGSSLYGSVEERQANEVRRLKRELVEAREQVMSLSTQLSTNAHVVSAFEQSLSNMKSRLHQLTETTERKDSELTDMRQTIELLRKQSIQAGLTSAHMQSMGLQAQSNTDQLSVSPRKQNDSDNLDHIKQTVNGGINTNRESATSNFLEVQQNHAARGSICSLNSISSACSITQDKKKKKSWLKSSFTKAFSKNAKISKTDKHISSIPNTPQKLHRTADNSNSNQKQTGSGGDEQNNFNLTNHVHAGSNISPPNSTKSSPQKCVTIIENAKPLDAIDLDGNPVVEDLKKQLREKDLILTDIRLEALSSASQLESLRDTVMKMRAEMLTLKQNNERLQKLVISRSLAGSEISLRNSISPNGSIISDSKRYSLVDSNRPHIELPKSLEEEVEEDTMPPAPAPEPPPPSTLPIQTTSPTTHIDLTPPPPAIEASSPTRSQPPMLSTVSEDVPDITEGKKIEIAVYLGQPESFSKYLEEITDSLASEVIYSNTNFLKDNNDDKDLYSNTTIELDARMYSNPNFHEFVIACTYISGKTTWQNLDYIVRKTFKDYLARIDSGTNLGLNTDSITSYHLGEAKRGPEIGFPQLLPCGYIIGNVKTLYICLQGVGSLAFDSLIPRSIVHRYITLLTEHRRLILCGPSGTGKSYLARKLAEFIVARDGRNNISEAIATFNVDNKSSKELRQFLSYIGEQASMPNGESELPSVIILDNLHHASALGDVFSSLLSSGPAAKLPCIIGTMSQATCNTTNLQLHHNFRWVLTANHMEPVKGFLGRYLKRRLYTLELHSQNHQSELTAVFAWLPTVWQHINRFLEIHSSSDVTIGPRLFLSCPLNLKDSQVWFTDIWNYHIVPYLIEAVREGVQLYGRRGGAWNDPSTFIRDTYPWKYGPDSVPPLRQINAEDVGLEGCEIGKSDSHDPLLNMLMHLQEAANYSENQEPESDCVSLDSNLTQDSSAGIENEGE